MITDPSGWRIKPVGDNVLFLVGLGVWNVDDTRRFCAEYAEVVRNLSGRPWAVLGDATDWKIDDKQVQLLLKAHNKWTVEAGCRAGSFYTGPGALNRLLLYRLVEPDSEQFQFRVHPHRRRAVEALSESGFVVTDSLLNSFFRGEGERI